MDGSKCWLSSQDLPLVSTHFYMGSIHPKVTSEIVMPRAPPQWPSSYLSFASVPVVKVTSRCQGQSNLGNAASNSCKEWSLQSTQRPCRHRHSQLNQWLHDDFEHYECIIFDEYIHGDVRSWASWQQKISLIDGSHWLTRAHIPITSKDIKRYHSNSAIS